MKLNFRMPNKHSSPSKGLDHLIQIFHLPNTRTPSMQQSTKPEDRNRKYTKQLLPTHLPSLLLNPPLPQPSINPNQHLINS